MYLRSMLGFYFFQAYSVNSVKIYIGRDEKANVSTAKVSITPRARLQQPRIPTDEK